ncbi:hypothetical protein [Pedobacter sp. BMA]|uniref:hypothetical protein n=1 Tax=Pedobacter sp. BMA TaxID=1663685 RepID=UPI00069E8F8B|nr:hypothetical protein [Pedobacter sp. BMA]
MTSSLQLIEKNICAHIIERLDKVGILYRIFSRSKGKKSLEEKIGRKEKEGKPYTIDGRKIQDIIGIRIVTYFQDDINLVKDMLSETMNFIDEEIDVHELTVFKPKRTNIICGFTSSDIKIFEETKAASQYEGLNLVDQTFELQLRTVLSEGWHEIDHSLRYKCKDEWEGHVEKERMLNGIYASLEVNDIALKSLFNELSYQHFKGKNWEAMFRNKFRLKFQPQEMRDDLKQIFLDDVKLPKKFLKVERETIIKELANTDIAVPVTFNNLIFFTNYFILKNERINSITPEFIKNCKE